MLDYNMSASARLAKIRCIFALAFSADPPLARMSHRDAYCSVRRAASQATSNSCTCDVQENVLVHLLSHSTFVYKVCWCSMPFL